VSEKFMDIRPPFKGTKYILVTPRVDLGSQLSGRPAAYIGVDDLVLVQKADGSPIAYMGRRKTGEKILTEQGEQDAYEPVIQLPPDAQYQLFLRNDIEFKPQLDMLKGHWDYEMKAAKLKAEVFKDEPDGNVAEEPPYSAGTYR